MDEGTFLEALHADPGDEVTWLALADWLEEDGQSDRAELLRLVRRLRALPVMKRTRARAALEGRVTELLLAGVRPVVAEITNSIGMRLALIPPGRFRMGSPANEPGRAHDETAHAVEITRPFYLGVFAVTQAQFRAARGSNPSQFCPERTAAAQGLDTGDFPVESVTWQNALMFCRWLSGRKEEKAEGRVYRLPTEAEWEYACRAGTSSAFAFGDALSSRLANFDGNRPHGGAEAGPYLNRPCAVGSYPPNAWGLYDMSGNVWEWCNDRYGEGYYRVSPRRDPPGPALGDNRPRRGGGWNGDGAQCRSADRCGGPASMAYENLGFRVACDVVG